MRRLSILSFAVLLLATACQSPPTSDQPSDTNQLEQFRTETNDRLEEITGELEGLDEKARRERLIELAQEEGATLTLYGVTNLEEMAENIDAFEEDTGMTVNYYRAGSEEILQRLVEEQKAGFRAADAVNENGAEMVFLDREGMFAPVVTPASEDLPEKGVHETWFWSYIDIFAPAWNPKLIPASEAPKTWQDVLGKYDQELLMEIGDIEWFATLVKHFVAEEGMTEEEAIALFEDAAKNATFVDGHTLMVELVAAGEYGIAASPYSHRNAEFKEDGAPVEWEPAVAPLVARPEGVAVHSTAEHPAAALLFVEWYLTDGQKLGLTQERQPASTAVPGGGLPEDYENIVVDVDAVLDEFDRWSELYDEIVQMSGEEVLVD